jgi:hypothetical protein
VKAIGFAEDRRILSKNFLSIDPISVDSSLPNTYDKENEKNLNDN